MKTSLSFLLLFFTTFTAFAQDYIIRDLSYVNGQLRDLRLYDNNRFVLYSKSKTARADTLKPDQIKEYGFKKGEVYVSRKVKEEGAAKSYFLKRLVDGKVKLYQLKTKNGSRFFAENEGGFIELEKATLSSSIPPLLTNCSNFEGSISSARFDRQSLKAVFTAYKTCYTGLLAKPRYGFIAGTSPFRFTLEGDSFSGQTLQLKGTSFTAGAFADLPLGRWPFWYIHTAAMYQGYKASEGTVFLNASLIHFPILLKYRTTGSQVRVFANAGPDLGYYLKRDNYFDYTGTHQPLESVTTTQINVTGGAGVEFSVSPVNIISLEVRYTSGRGSGAGEYKQSISATQFLVGWHF